MSRQTAFLSRFIGLYCILISLAMVRHKQATVEIVFITGDGNQTLYRWASL